MSIYLYTPRKSTRKIDIDGKLTTVYQYQFACKATFDNIDKQYQLINRASYYISDRLLSTAIFVYGDFCEGSSVFRANPGHAMPLAAYDNTLGDMLLYREIDFLGRLIKAGKKGRGYQYALDRKPAFLHKLRAPAKPVGPRNLL